MGKRYYCDYCDKSFPDNPTNRRNHMNGVQHRTVRSLHYSTFQDPEIMLAEDAQKNPCRQFFQTGECRFGTVCKFSHLSVAEKEQILAAVTAKKHRDLKKSECLDYDDILERWITQWSQNRQSKATPNCNVTSSTLPCAADLPTSELPAVVAEVQQLPPSLRPPVVKVNHDFMQTSVEWG